MSGEKLDMAGAIPTEAIYRRRNSLFNKDTWRRFKKNKSALIGLIIFLVFIFFLIFADIISSNDLVYEQNIADRMQGMSAEHWFGTDVYGRDMFARTIHATRYSLFMGIVSVAVGIVLGSVIAAVAGLYGGKIDSAIMWVMDTVLCIPFMLLALAIVAALGGGLQNLLLALVISSVPIYVRVIRASILTVVDSDFVEAARCCGTPDRFIVLKHIMEDIRQCSS